MLTILDGQTQQTASISATGLVGKSVVVYALITQCQWDCLPGAQPQDTNVKSCDGYLWTLTRHQQITAQVPPFLSLIKRLVLSQPFPHAKTSCLSSLGHSSVFNHKHCNFFSK